ncbi:hypothetical protein OA105_01235 [Prochlorococcus sp. AH-736-B08]|nr:hypothetical protein [Prochlorococcus sp. AH-736-B08]
MFSSYQPKNSFDEYFKDNVNSAREILIPLLSSLDNMGLEELKRNHSAAKKLLLRHGATFRLNDCPIMYKKVSLEKMRHKLEAILSIDEVTIGNCISPVLFR